MPPSPSTPDRAPGPPRWPWVALGLALAWDVLVRIPLVLNAAAHLDCDLAVDGLTLLEATHGHWRWHYPGTPSMGSIPVLLSWPQAVVWGAEPDHARLGRHGRLRTADDRRLSARLAGVRAGGGRLEPRAAGVRVDRHALALRPDHRRTLLTAPGTRGRSRCSTRH